MSAIQPVNLEKGEGPSAIINMNKYLKNKAARNADKARHNTQRAIPNKPLNHTVIHIKNSRKARKARKTRKSNTSKKSRK